MAITSNTYTGNGSNRLFSITFPYLNTTDIDVYLNGILQTVTTQYTFANATTVEFVTAPANGAVVLLDRSTDDSVLQATFFPGSSIKAADLNADFDQTLYVVQEINNKAVKKDDPLYVNKTYIDAADATKVSKSGDTMSGNLVMGGNKVTGLGTTSNASDAATKQYVDDNALLYSGSPAFTQDGTGAVTRSWSSKLKDTVSVKDFGAVGNGVVDDTAAIQAAINSLSQYDSLYFPAGQYLVSSTLTLNTSYVSLIGDGSGATTILRLNGNYGNTLQIQPVDPTTGLILSVTVSGIKLRADVEMNSGAHLSLTEVTQSQFSDVFLEDGFIGIHIKGVRNSHFEGSKIESGKYFSTLKTGSRFVLVEDSPKAGQENTEVFFDGFNWTFTVNATIDYGLEIKESDGIWFSNGHILGAATADCYINLASSPQLMGLQFDNVWFDGFTNINVYIADVPSGTAKDLNFNSCTFSGSANKAIYAASTSNFSNINFNGCIFQNSNGVGVHIQGGTRWSFTGCTFIEINRGSVANAYAIRAENTVNLSVSGGFIGHVTYPLAYGIQLVAVASKFAITGVAFYNITLNEIDVPTSAELIGQVNGCNTDRVTFNSVTLSSNVATVPAIATSAYISGTGTIDRMLPAWEGRQVLLVGNAGSFTVTHNIGSNQQFLNNGNVDITLAAGRGKLYQYFAASNSWLNMQ
jgi:hypothetical protein